jgi:hypothetical protein
MGSRDSGGAGGGGGGSQKEGSGEMWEAHLRSPPPILDYCRASEGLCTGVYLLYYFTVPNLRLTHLRSPPPILDYCRASEGVVTSIF